MNELCQIRSFDRLAPELPEREILTRLGGNCVRTVFTPEQKTFFRKTMCEAFALCHPCGRCALLDVQSNDGTRIRCENGFEVIGSDFAARFPDIRKLWVAAVTVGRELTDRIAAMQDNIAVAAIYDATGSECADAALDFLQRLITQELRKSGLTLRSRRYSPGYGNVDLAHQDRIFELLRLQEIGIKLTGTHFFLPEKSVSAFGAAEETRDL